MTVQKVEARFWVKEIVHHHNGGQGDQPVTIKLAVAYNNGQGNTDWAKYTPSGEISMMVTNPDAVAMFELGKHYKIEFSPAEN